MKIIVSPSKTQSNDVLMEELNHPIFYTQSKQIIKEIKSYKKDELSKIMHIKGKLLDETYQLYKQYKVNSNVSTPALSLYTGVVYDSLKIHRYNESQLNYLNDNVRIISALYGVLCPMDGVQMYRLDFTMKLKNISLNSFWKDRIIKYFKHETLILDCASLEFSHFLNPLKEKVHRVEFIDNVDGQDKIISYNAKKLRGLMANYCIENQVESIELIREFNEEGYSYQSHLSDMNKSIFIRYSSATQL